MGHITMLLTRLQILSVVLESYNKHPKESNGNNKGIELGRQNPNPINPKMNPNLEQKFG